MRKLCSLLVLLAGALLFVACGSSVPKLDSQGAKSFDKASPELKQVWDKALAADKTNDYVAAGASYAALLSQNLTPEQLQAVQTASASLNQKMYAAAAKGDAAAKAAIEQLQAARQRRR